MPLALALLLLSSTFHDGGRVPLSMVAKPCGGQNLAPALVWRDAPRKTRSFALIMRDVDAAAPGGFYHWGVYDIPPSLRSRPEGAGNFGGGLNGWNDDRRLDYYGPCPPPGKVHHYQLTLYALDERIAPPFPPPARSLEETMRGHILAQSTITGTWSSTGEGNR